MLKYLLFEGGLYKHELMTEYLEDVGGFIVQKNVAGLDLIMNLAVPEEELENVKKLAAELKGKIKLA
ncbi:MAG TPA: methyl-coenzyme M reductase family protein, partial [Candidatus Methanomethylicus sp.]|nr:methyl-coenzyme M reductase family protein [Candidatus Methanomethylicus sp.]